MCCFTGNATSLLKKDYLLAWEEGKRRGDRTYLLIWKSNPSAWLRQSYNLHFNYQKVIHGENLEWFKSWPVQDFFSYAVKVKLFLHISV